MEAQLDPFFWRTASYVIVFVGTGLVLLGSVGTWYFGNEAERVAPYRQLIRSATSTVEVLIRSGEPFDNVFMDRGGYLALGKGNQALLTTAGSQCLGKQLGGGRVMFRGVFEMDANDPAVGRPVAGLREAEYAQIKFLPMPEAVHVLEGKAVVTVNSAVRVELSIPEQEVTNGLIFVRGLARAFSEFR